MSVGMVGFVIDVVVVGVVGCRGRSWVYGGMCRGRGLGGRQHERSKS